MGLFDDLLAEPPPKAGGGMFDDLLEAPPEEIAKGRLRSAAATFAKSVSEGEADVVKGLVRFATSNPSAMVGPGAPMIPMPGNRGQQEVNRALSRTAEQKSVSAEQEPLYQAAEQFADAAGQVYRPNPIHAQSFWFGDVPAAFGSTVPPIAAGLLGGPGAAVGAYAMQSGEQGAQEAIAAGRVDQADKLFLAFAVAAGASEAALGVGPRIWSLVRKARAAGVEPGRFQTWLRLTGQSAVRESAQEGLEQTIQNIAVDQLAQDRPWFEGVPKAMALGGIVGGHIGGAAAGVGVITRPGEQTEVLPEHEDELPAPPAATQPPTDTDPNVLTEPIELPDLRDQQPSQEVTPDATTQVQGTEGQRRTEVSPAEIDPVHQVAVPEFPAVPEAQDTSTESGRVGLVQGTKAEAWADEVIRDAAKNVNAGINPTLLAAYVVKGAALVEDGVLEFKAWSGQMLREYGAQIEPYLAAVYQRATLSIEEHMQRWVGKPLKQVAARVPMDAESPTLQPRTERSEMLRQIAEVYNAWPDEVVAADGTTIVIRNPEHGSHARRVRHLTTDENRQQFRVDKAEWVPAVPDTIRNAAVRLRDDQKKSHVFLRRYGDGTGHYVVVRDVDGVVDQGPFDGGIITQFAKAQPGRHGEMPIVWARGRWAPGSAHGAPGPDPEGSPSHDSTSRMQPSHPAEAGRQDQPTPQPDAVNELIDRLKVDLPPGSMLEGVTGMPVIVWNASLEVVRAAYNAGKTLAEAVAAGIAWIRKHAPDLKFDEAAYRKAVESELAERQHGQKVLDAPDVQPGIKDRLVNLGYTIHSNETDAAFAARIISQSGGPEQAIPVFADTANALPSATRSMLGMEIVKGLSQASRQADGSGNLAEANRINEVAARFLDEQMLPYTTELAQGLQALSAWQALTPEGRLVWAQRQVRQAADKATSSIRPEIEQAKTEVQRVNAETAERAARSAKAQGAARAAVDAATQAEVDTPGTELHTIVRRKATDAAAAIPDLGQFDVSVRELVRHHYQSAEPVTMAERLKGRLNLTDAQASALAKKVEAAFVREVERLKAEVKRAAQRIRKDPRAVRAVRAGIVDIPGIPGSELELALARAIQARRMQLGKLVREHWTKLDQAGNDLAADLVAKAGIPKTEADQFAQVLTSQFAQMASARKQRVLNQLLRPARARGLVKPGLIERLVQLSNLGAFTDAQWFDAVREKLDLPTWTPELAKSLREQADAIQQIPEGQIERLQKAQREFLSTIERAKGMSLLDMGLAFFVTNLLSGPTTHSVNMLSTGLQTSGTVATEIERAIVSGRPGDVLLILEALGKGIQRGLQSARDVWKTGAVTGTRLKKMEPGRGLELVDFGRKGGVPLTGQGLASKAAKALLESKLAGVLNAWKYNYRAMGAEDLMFFRPAEEVKAAMLAAQLGRTRGLSPADARADARRILGYGAEAVERARAQAKAEGHTGHAAKRREAEILQQARPNEITETAAEYGRRSTFNNDPYGFLGRISDLLNRAKASEDPKLRTAATVVAPFTTIISNVTNELLNWGPVGAYRALRTGDSMLGVPTADMTLAQKSDLRAELLAKATTGIVMTAAIAMTAAQYLDDDDPPFAIYGAGPNDPKDRRGLEAKRWIPHSIKLGDRYFAYSYSPVAIWMAIIGNLMDQHRDARIYDNRQIQRLMESTPDRIASAALQGSRVITEMSFLQGIVDLAGIVSADQPGADADRFMRLGARTAVGVVVPNAVQQIDRTMDPVRRQASDLDGIIVGAIPFARRRNQPSLDALGREIRYAPMDRYGRATTQDPLVNRLADRGLWPELPDRNRVYPRKGRPMDEAEYYDYVHRSGQLIQERLNRWRRRWDVSDPERARQAVSEIVSDARAQTRRRMGF